MATTRGTTTPEPEYGRVIRVTPHQMEAMYAQRQVFDRPKGAPQEPEKRPVAPVEAYEAPEDAQEAAIRARRERWAAQDAAEEEGWVKQERFLAEVEGREPDFGLAKTEAVSVRDQTALGRRPRTGSIVPRTRAQQRSAPSNVPTGRRARYLRSLVRAGKFLTVEEANQYVPTRNRS